jgi:hypothetical protein
MMFLIPCIDILPPLSRFPPEGIQGPDCGSLREVGTAAYGVGLVLLYSERDQVPTLGNCCTAGFHKVDNVCGLPPLRSLYQSRGAADVAAHRSHCTCGGVCSTAIVA